MESKSPPITVLWVLFLFLSLSCSLRAASVDEWTQAAEYHLLIKDYNGACTCMHQGIQEHPQNYELRRHLVLVYASAGLEQEALEAWKDLRAAFGDHCDDNDIMEAVAWCVLERGISNPAPMTRLAAFASAAGTRDARVIAFLRQGFCDSCGLVRAVSCKVAGELRVDEFMPMMLRLADADRSVVVRVAALETLSALKIDGVKALILRRLSNGEVGREERLAMAKCMAILDIETPLESFKKFASSQDTALRCLAAEYAIYTRLLEGTPILWRLVADPQMEVKATALQALAVLWPQWKITDSQLQLVRNCAANTQDGVLAVCGAWVLSLCRPEEGMACLTRLCGHPKPQVRASASAALSSCGLKALPYLKNLVAQEATIDPYVCFNAALGLLKMREDIVPCCALIERMLMKSGERFSKTSLGLLQPIVDCRYGEQEALTPELCDVAVRLEILQLLAILKVPCASKMLESFLLSKAWGVSGIASLVLLSEDNEGAIDLVEDLLVKATNAQIRLQAALVLGMWGKSDSAVEPLHQAYWGAGRETKERILGALGSIGSERSIPFLCDAMNEPSSSLRIQAAAALLRIIYK